MLDVVSPGRCTSDRGTPLQKKVLNLFFLSNGLREICHFTEVDWWAAKENALILFSGLSWYSFSDKIQGFVSVADGVLNIWKGKLQHSHHFNEEGLLN